MPQSVRSIIQIENRKTLASEIAEVVQRKVFTTPDHNEADDVSVKNIIPRDRSLNKVRVVCRCLHRRRMSSKKFDIHGQTILQLRAALCVKTMLDAPTRWGNRLSLRGNHEDWSKISRHGSREYAGVKALVAAPQRPVSPLRRGGNPIQRRNRKNERSSQT